MKKLKNCVIVFALINCVQYSAASEVLYTQYGTKVDNICPGQVLKNKTGTQTYKITDETFLQQLQRSDCVRGFMAAAASNLMVSTAKDHYKVSDHYKESILSERVNISRPPNDDECLAYIALPMGLLGWIISRPGKKSDQWEDLISESASYWAGYLVGYAAILKARNSVPPLFFRALSSLSRSPSGPTGASSSGSTAMPIPSAPGLPDAALGRA